MKYERINICIVAAYGVINRYDKERKGFWSYLVNRVGNGYILCMMGNLNIYVVEIVR